MRKIPPAAYSRVQPSIYCLISHAASLWLYKSMTHGDGMVLQFMLQIQKGPAWFFYGVILRSRITEEDEMY